MARTLSKNRSKSRSSPLKSDMVIKAQATSTKIVDITNDTVRMESNNKGQARGKLYSGMHWDTVEGTMLADGSATLTIRYMHVTDKGETVVGTGTGTQSAPNSKGIASITGEGTMWTSAPRLEQLNGARWTVKGEYNFAKESVEVRAMFDTSGVS